MKEGCEYKTVTLKWCTPRGSSGSELQHCIAATRITPTDVNSRPSSCLTNFLLAGRSVMLEMPRRSGWVFVFGSLSKRSFNLRLIIYLNYQKDGIKMATFLLGRRCSPKLSTPIGSPPPPNCPVNQPIVVITP